MDLFDIRNQLSLGKNIYELNLKVTYYARVSTDKDEQLHSIKNQIDYYENYIKENPNWVFVEGYIDEGLSATSVKKRDSFIRMIEDAELHKFDFIITKEISRFSRNTLDSIKYTQKLLSYGVGVLFQSDNINTLMPDSELRLTIMSGIAQDEVRKISERVSFGFQRAIEKGVVLGSNNMWGYVKDNGKLIVVPEEAKIVEKIFDLYANKRKGIRTICNILSEQGVKNSKGNDVSFSTVKGILTNPKYKGFYCGRKTRKIDYRSNEVKCFDESEWVMYRDEESVPAIVSEELWDRANRILAKRSAQQSAKDKTSYQNKYPYSGKIICLEHDAPYYRALYKYKSGSKEVWQCRQYANKGKKGCSSPILYTSELNEVIKQSLDILKIDKQKIISEMLEIYSLVNCSTSYEKDTSNLQRKILEVNSRKDKLLDLCMKGHITDLEFEERNNNMNKELEALQQGLEEIKIERAKTNEISSTLGALKKVIAKELDFEDGLDVNTMDSLLDRMEVLPTTQKSNIRLRVIFKVLEPPLEFAIHRGKSITSV